TPFRRRHGEGSEEQAILPRCRQPRWTASLVKSGMPETFEELLDRATAACAVDSGYWDIWGNHHPASAAVKQAILASAGLASGTAPELDRALAERERAEWQRLLPPSVVISQSGPHTLPINVPEQSL